MGMKQIFLFSTGLLSIAHDLSETKQIDNLGSGLQLQLAGMMMKT
jgi:hypothetical protein